MTEAETPASMVPPDLMARLKAVAVRSNRSLGECLHQAISEYCDTWESYHDAVDGILKNDEGRRRLHVVND